MSKISWLIVTTDVDHSVGLFVRQASEARSVSVVNYRDLAGVSEKYDIVYLRDPFTQGWGRDMLRSVDEFMARNQWAHYIDAIKRADDLLIEDKWRQYLELGDFMPQTQLLSEARNIPDQFIIKKRISARSRDIYFELSPDIGDRENYIVQPRLSILEEYRVYSIGGELTPCAIKRSSKTPSSKTKAVESVALFRGLEDFCRELLGELKDYDLLGLDIAITPEGPILLEVNRSPQFTRYIELSGYDLAQQLAKAVERKY